MARKLKQILASVMIAVMLIGLVPDTAIPVFAEEIQEVMEEQSTEEQVTEEVVTEEITTEEQTTEKVTEASTEIEVTTEQVTEELTTEIQTTEALTESTEEVTEETLPSTEAQESTETEVKDEKKTRMVAEKVMLLEDTKADGKTIYSDGTWSSGNESGIVWYVNDNGKKHYSFCLNKGKTMYTGAYSGVLTTGYSGKSAFQKAVALNFFYKSNGNSWNGKKIYGVVQEVIWGSAASSEAKKLETYINHAWKLTSLNPDRAGGSSSYNGSKLTPIKRSEQESDAARKKMIGNIKNSPIKIIPTADGTLSKTISLSGTAWKYMTKGGYTGTKSDISVVGIYDDEGKKVDGRASVGTDGKLSVNVKVSSDRGDDKAHPLTIIMSVGFDYLGARDIRYLETGRTINGGKVQNVTYDTSFDTPGYFALQIYGKPSYESAKVYVNKIDEYANPVSGCTFKLEALSGDALNNPKLPREIVVNSFDDYFDIEYTGRYRITETAVPNTGEYELNTTPFEFDAVLDDKGNIIISYLPFGIVSPPGVGEIPPEFQNKGEDTASFTYTCVNKSTSGNATLTKYGNVLVGFRDGKFTYEKRKLEDVGFSFFAAEDIYLNDTLVFTKNEEITHGRGWGRFLPFLPGIGVGDQKNRSHEVEITGKEILVDNPAHPTLPKIRYVYTNTDGQMTISDLPAGDYYCLETKFIDGFSKIQGKHEFEIKAGKTITINGSDGIINEQPVVTAYVYKVDRDTEEPLDGAEFTIYANIGNLNYDKKPIFTKADTVPVVTKRNLLTGEETIVKDSWIPVAKATSVNGFVSFGEMPLGKYLIAETKAPEGYTLPEETYEFEHTAKEDEPSNGYIVKYTFKDMKERTYQILKHAEKPVAADTGKTNQDVYIYEDKPVKGVCEVAATNVILME